MTPRDLAVLAPFEIVTLTTIAVMLLVVVRRHHATTATLTFLGLVIAFISLWVPGGQLAQSVSDLLIIDVYSRFFMGLIFLVSMGTVITAFGYFREPFERPEEFYILLLSAALGAAVVVSSNHLVSFFLGLELLSVSLYAMIAYAKESDRSLEAGIKYLILAATSSAFLLFGFALIYAELGTVQFAEISVRLTAQEPLPNALLAAGLALTIVGFGFKLGIVPFHMWTSDVYEGAPAPVTAFLATVSKGAMVALFVRFFLGIPLSGNPGLLAIFCTLSVLSMFIGNFLALAQSNVKRILAYSSIAHLGYILVAFIAGGKMAVEAISYYLVAYFLTTLAAFGVVSILSSGSSERTELEDYRGLFWERPWIAAVFTAALLSLAGIPLTAGFIGKYLVVTAGVATAQWLLVIILVVNSAIGLFYYLRVIVATVSRPERAVNFPDKIGFGNSVVLAVVAVGLVVLGVYPAPLIELVRFTIYGLLG